MRRSNVGRGPANGKLEVLVPDSGYFERGTQNQEVEEIGSTSWF